MCIIRVEIPAIDNLVDFLRECQQGQVDELAAKVDVLTERLRKSSAGLYGSVNQQTTTNT